MVLKVDLVQLMEDPAFGKQSYLKHPSMETGLSRITTIYPQCENSNLVAKKITNLFRLSSFIANDSFF